MKKHYIAAYNTTEEIRAAITRGELLRPYVVIEKLFNELAYDGQYEPYTISASVSTTSVSYSGGTVTLSMNTGEDGLDYIISLDGEFLSSGNTYDSTSEDIEFDPNLTEYDKTFKCDVEFYDSDTYILSSSFTITQNCHIVGNGYVDTTGITIDNAWGSEAYFTVYGEDLYWEMSGDPWIEFNWGSEGEGTQNKAIRVGQNPAGDRTGKFTVYFYTDWEKQELKNTFEVEVSQAGQGNTVPSFSPDYYVELITASTYTGGSVTVYILNNEENQFYWTVNAISGTPSDTQFTYEYSENTGYQPQSTAIFMMLYRDANYSQWAGSKVVYLVVPGNPDASNLELANNDWFDSTGGSNTVSVNYRSNAVSANLSINSEYDFITFANGETTATSDTSNTAFTINIAYNPSDVAGSNRNGSVNAEFFDENGNSLGTDYVIVVQWGPKYEVKVVETFVTASDNETVNCPTGIGFDGHAHGGKAMLEDGTWVEVSGGTYTFASAGTHTLTYLRESSDMFLQNWLQNSDCVSIFATGTAEWGFHNSDSAPNVCYVLYNNPNLTAVTFDSNFSRIGGNNFSGCTALTEIHIMNPTGVTLDNSSFASVPSTGVLYVPKGCDSNPSYIDLAGYLGESWTITATTGWLNAYVVTESADTQAKIVQNGRNIDRFFVDGIPVDATGLTGGNYTFPYAGEHHVYAEISDPQASYPSFKDAKFSRFDIHYVSLLAAQGYSQMTDLLTYKLDNVETVKNGALRRSPKVQGLIEIPDTVTVLDATALQAQSDSQYGATGSNITAITVGSGITSIGYSVFAYNDHLKTIVFDDNAPVTGFANGMFAGCTALTGVTFPANVQVISGSTQYPMFDGCESLEQVEFGSGTTEIQEGMFTTANTRLTLIIANPATAPTIAQSDLETIAPNNGEVWIHTGADYSSWSQYLPGWTFREYLG